MLDSLKLESLKRVGREVEQQLSRAWESLSEGWKELLVRGSGALTRFTADGKPEDSPFLGWGLLPAEIVETDNELLVRLEIAGIAKSDCEITLDGNTLVVRGEKKVLIAGDGANYLLMERAYGRFERVIPLPVQVDDENSKAAVENGVLMVTMPKKGSRSSRTLEVS